MLHIWLVTAVSFVYGIATGLVNSAAPQAADSKLKLSSAIIGLVGAGIPAGYAAGCFLCGRFLTGISGKRVLISGAVLGAVSLAMMALARDAAILVTAQILFGAASGAVWPFISAWLLDFEFSGVSRTRILRHYNVSWTGGTATGMYVGGNLCTHNWIFESFWIAAVCSATVVVLALTAREAPKVVAPLSNAPLQNSPLPQRARVNFAMLMAAVLFNFVAIGTKIIISSNYAELNRLQGLEADRMGLFMAAGTMSQLAAFGLARWFEPWLGLRRLYALGAMVLIAVNLAFAQTIALPVLVVAEVALGFTLAAAFQCSITAFISRSHSPRAGTTLFEATIGLSGLAPLAAGKLSEILKSSGTPVLDALRAPFYFVIGLICVSLFAQLFILPSERERRCLAYNR